MASSTTRPSPAIYTDPCSYINNERKSGQSPASAYQITQGRAAPFRDRSQQDAALDVSPQPVRNVDYYQLGKASMREVLHQVVAQVRSSIAYQQF